MKSGSPPTSFGFGLSVVLACTSLGVATDLDFYSTDFEGFPTGNDELVGNDGWVGSSTGSGSHGIDENAIPGLGKSGFLGFNPPIGDPDFVAVWRDLEDDPVTAGNETINFSAIIGIADSTNGEFDAFSITFINTDEEAMAALLFDNSPEAFGIWRYDGSALGFTDDTFVNDEIHDLLVTIDFAANRWSALLDEVPIFENEIFSSSVAKRTLLSVEAAWEISDPRNPGDNWLLFDEWSIFAEVDDPPPTPEPFSISTVTATGGNITLTWPAQNRIVYQVEYSEDGMQTWKTDLPNSLLTATAADTVMTYTLTSGGSPPGERYFRVVGRSPE